MKQAKEWKVVLTGNELDGYKKETLYVWSDKRDSAKNIAMGLSRLNVLCATATTQFTKPEKVNRKEVKQMSLETKYTVVYNNKYASYEVVDKDTQRVLPGASYIYERDAVSECGKVNQEWREEKARIQQIVTWNYSD